MDKSEMALSDIVRISLLPNLINFERLESTKIFQR